MPRYDADYTPASAMTIFAHPDDAEFGVAGTLAKWSRSGCEVTMVLCTSGNVGSPDAGSTIQDVAEIREREQQNAATVIGAANVVFLRYDDCQLQPTLDLRRDLVRVLRQYRPEVVLCNDPTGWFFGSGYVNHPDHRAAGAAALEAIFPCAEMPLLWPETGPAHKVSAVYVAWTDERDVWIDITGTLSTKLEALRAHASQLGDWDPEDTVTDWASSDAREGRKHAEQVRTAAVQAPAMAPPKAPPEDERRFTESFRVMVLRHEDRPPES